ncbi:MAG TPA: PEP-CTERM sorting domain-containing protein [Phycisphaerae bacterium]|nr:PEP-CTERM sorting domain-containing protein [Phycisphaerales bacterium]HRX86473.1 PEP-CTERM sorting domain-containing protein [Phycisphaerae bacterium]
MTPRNRTGATLATAVAVALLTTGTALGDIAPLEAGSTTVVNGGSVVIEPVVWWADMGEYFGNGRAYVVPLQLPTLPGGTSFASADLAFVQHGPGVHPVDGRTGFFGGSAPDYNIDLYGLDRIASIPDVLDVDHYSGPADPNATLLQDAFLDPSSPGDRTVIHTDAGGDTSLTAWLNTMYANGANAGEYVFLRFNPDGPEGSLPWSGYELMTVIAGGADEKPVFSYTVTPEPSMLALLGLGAGVVLRRRR